MPAKSGTNRKSAEDGGGPALAIELVIGGGQTGADQAGWRAAHAAGIPTGGSMPRGFLTVQGPRPEFAATFGAVELEAPDYPPRTRANVRDSDGTLIFGNPATRGGAGRRSRHVGSWASHT
jgi:predicted Rossmann-fold nucleotide-binding protein